MDNLHDSNKSMTQTEALKLALEAHKKNERHNTVAETRYWCDQYKLLAEQALAQPEQRPVVVMELYTVGWDLVENIDIDWLESLPFGTKLYTIPPQRKPLTDEMVLAGARALAKRHADSCGLDFDDVWKYYADEHKDDAKVVIEAAHGIKEKNT